MADRRPAALADLIGYHLHLTDLVALRDARAALADLQTTPAKVTALAFIRDDPGCDQSSLGRFLEVNRASAMKLVNSLQDRGLVERREGRDRRSNGLHLTAQGQEALQSMVAALVTSEARLVRHLTLPERRELLRLLTKVRETAATPDGLEQEPEQPAPKRSAV